MWHPSCLSSACRVLRIEGENGPGQCLFLSPAGRLLSFDNRFAVLGRPDKNLRSRDQRISGGIYLFVAGTLAKVGAKAPGNAPMRVTCLAFATTLLVSGPGLALADWQVERVSGAAAVVRDGLATALAKGQTVEDGAVVETGANGRVMLSKGGSTIMVGPRSSLSMDHSFFGGTTT